jgi:crossover junction endodeoxyribonuclease RuvC
MRVLGVDPGISGGVAVIDLVDGAAPQLIDATDIPTTGLKAKRRVDALALHAWLMLYQPQHAYIERAQSMPRQGSSSGFLYGRSVGAIEATVVCCEIPMTIVEPSAWKKFHGLLGSRGDKEASRQRALQLFPSAHAMLARRMDHGRAEAVLIALAGARLLEIGRAAA